MPPPPNNLAKKQQHEFAHQPETTHEAVTTDESAEGLETSLDHVAEDSKSTQDNDCSYDDESA